MWLEPKEYCFLIGFWFLHLLRSPFVKGAVVLLLWTLEGVCMRWSVLGWKAVSPRFLNPTSSLGGLAVSATSFERCDDNWGLFTFIAVSFNLVIKSWCTYLKFVHTNSSLGFCLKMFKALELHIWGETLRWNAPWTLSVLSSTVSHCHVHN
jgi:hypothetical protein